MHKPFNIVQICRRFGPVGGMERYVWALSHELAKLGHQVHVLCEVNLCKEPLADVHIHELAQVRPKPRWLAHIRFSKHVQQWLAQHQTPNMIIHSHERTADHQITTFHGPPFAKVRDLPIWKRFSLRTKMNLWLEERELCNPQVQMIVPNSEIIAKSLQHYYPSIAQRITAPVVPGVADIPKRPNREIPDDGGIIGFIGKEWKRKGLEKAIAIMNELVNIRPQLHFMVAGAQPQEIQHLFDKAKFSYELLGKTDVKSLYPQLDLLLHPAISEPFGMVITEALNAGVPVVISDSCGAVSEINPQSGSALAATDSNGIWANEVLQWLNRENLSVQYQYSWHDMAMNYIVLYQKLMRL